MPNWKKLIVSGSDAALNSLNITSALTASGLIYPTSDGSGGQVLVTDGAGNLSFDIPDAEKLTFEVQNGETFTLAKGTPIHVSSSTNGTSIVIAASASDASTMPSHGVLNQQLTAGSDGVATITGNINGIDTSAFSVGDTIYVGASGGYTNVKPQGSDNLIQNLGVVRKVDASNGTAEIFGSGRSNDVPNLPEGKIWVGSSNYTVTSSVAHLDESNGRLGIGTTSPAEKLTVEGTISASGDLTLTDVNPSIKLTDTNQNSDFSINVNGGVFNIKDETNSLARISLKSNGNVGIGTTSPAEKLTVEGTISGSGCIQIGTGHVNSGTLASIAGGTLNTNLAACSFIGGGENNTINGTGNSNTIGGGNLNIIKDSVVSFIGGGFGNHVCKNYGVIGGGYENRVTGSSGHYGVVAGGRNNQVCKIYGGILGGTGNTVSHTCSFIIGANITSDKNCYTFMNNLDVAGIVSASTFSGSFVGDGSNLTSITADSVPFTGITGTPTIISSSLQFDTITSPFTGSFTGSFTGDGSGLTNINAEVTEQATVSDTFTSTTSKVVTHNFDTKNIIVIVYNSSDQQILPATLTTTDNNNVTVTFDTATSGRVVVAKGGHIVSGSVTYSALIGKPFFEGSQTNITSGSVTNINTIPTSSYSAAIFDYAAYSGSNARAGTLTSTNVGTTITYNEVSTSDIGDTTPLELSVAISGSNFTLQALTSTSGWAVKSHGTGI